MSFLRLDKKRSSSGNLEIGGFQPFYLVSVVGGFDIVHRMTAVLSLASKASKLS